LSRLIRKGRISLLGIFALLAVVAFEGVVPGEVAAQSARSRVKQGNELFTQQKYDQALNRYQDALLAAPADRRIHYNVADALYKKKKYEEALKSYQKVLGAEDLQLEAKAYYNIGNTLYRLGKLPESILAYQQALKLNPNDMDAKYNLEYVRRKLKENAKKQPQNSQSQQQQRRQQSQQQQSQQNQNRKQQQKQQQTQGQQQKGQQRKLTKEEAERILNALKNDEKKIQKKRRMQVRGKVRVDKDW